MSKCCDEYLCKRQKPFMFFLGGFTGRWYMATDYTERAVNGQGGHYTATRKHDVHDQLVGALLAAGWTPPSTEVAGEATPEMKDDES